MLLVVALALTASTSEAARSIAYPVSATTGFGLAAFATLPVQLSPAANGATISSTNTSSSASVTATAGGVLDATSNNTAMKNPGSQDLRVRLVFRAASGDVADCTVCKLQILQGATRTDEISISAGVPPAVGAAGPLVTLSAGATLYIGADAKATLPTQSAYVTYWLEILPSAGTSPSADYLKMNQTFVV